MDTALTKPHAFPRKPYDEVTSEFVRDEIRRGSFDDLDYRRYVNELVWLEWYTNEGVGPNTTGISAYGLSVHRWKVAAAYPEAYDAVRRDLGASTRGEDEWTWNGEEDSDERRQWAQQHQKEWQAVQAGKQRAPEVRTELKSHGSRSFAPFRFPVVPYDSIQSPFIREEIERGSFDDLEYRQRVNKLAWIEWFTTDWDRGGLFGQTAKNWRLAAEHPQDFDIIRRELGEETREVLELSGEMGCGDIDAGAAARKHKRAWQAVQEGQWSDEIEPDRTGRRAPSDRCGGGSVRTGLYEFEDTGEVRHPLGLYRDFLSGRLSKVEEHNGRLVVEDQKGEHQVLRHVPDPSEGHDRTEAEQRFLQEYRATHDNDVADGLILAQARLLGEI